MRYQAFLFLLLCNLLWAGNFVFGKILINEFSPMWITFLRWLIACSLLFPIAARYENLSYDMMKKILKNSWVILTCMGITGGILFNLFTYSALQFTTPTNGTLVFSLTPAITMIFSFIIWKEKISLVQLSGLIVSFLGVTTLLTGGKLMQVFQMDFNKGDLLMIGADVCWMIYAFLCKKSDRIPPVTAVALSSLIAVVIMIPFLIVQPLPIYQISTMGFNGILYVGFFASVCAFVLWNFSVRTVGTNIANLTVNLIPVYTAMITLLLGGVITGAQLWGGGMVILGLLLTSQKRNDSIEIYVSTPDVDICKSAEKCPYCAN